MSFPVKTEPSTPGMFPSSSRSSSSAPRSARAFQPKVKKEEQVPELDENGNANYADYRLVSSGDGGWNFNVIKFHSSSNTSTSFSPLDLPQPALLNRKDPRPRPPPPPPTLDEHGNVVEELKPVLDIHGKPMLGPDGKVMFATGKKGPAADLTLIAPNGGAVKNRKNLFKKKTKQIFKVSQDRMRLRREERHPWVLEGNPAVPPAEGASTVPGETWVGRMEDTGDKSFVMFVFEDDKNEFQIMDIRRWYKFQQRPAYQTLNMDEAEEMYARTMKGKDPRRWVMHAEGRVPAPAAAGSSVAAQAGASRPSSSRVKVEDQLPSYLRRSAPANGSSSGGGGSAGRPKQEMMDWEDDGGEEGGGRRRNEGGGEGDADADFEDEFSDDDGQMEFDQADEAENKELEERLKREFRQDGTAPDEQENDAGSDEDLFGDEALKGERKAIKKALKKNTRGDTYASDDESNPYASSDESDSDSPPSPPPAAASTATTATGLLVPAHNSSSSRPSNSSSNQQSVRHSSPGAALLAQRSISPRRTTKPRSRSGSPSASSPTASGSSNKRKSGSGGDGGGSDGGKKVRLEQGQSSGSGSGSGGQRSGGGKPPSEREIVKYIRKESPDVSKLIQHFKKSMKSSDPNVTMANKTALIEVVKRVADLVDKVLVCKPEYAQ